MQHKQVSLLQCPYCLKSFSVAEVWQKAGQDIRFGSLYCLCDEFPVIEGILYLFKPTHRLLLDLLRARKFTEATLLCISQKRLLRSNMPWMKFGGMKLMSWLLDPSFLKRIGQRNVIRLLSHLMPKHLLEYYFTRGKWKDSFLIGVPLAILLEREKKQKVTSKSLYWFDIGSGIVNYFAEIQAARKNIQIISLDAGFSNLFLSQIFYPGQDVIRICGDAHFIQLVRPQTIDVVSIIDTLQCLSAPVPFLTELLDPLWLKKDAQVFVSGLPEHLYLDRDWGIFPTPRSIIQQYFSLRGGKKVEPVFLNNEALSAAFCEGTVELKKVILTTKQRTFRYSFWWSQTQRLPKQLSSMFFSQAQRENATLSWETSQRKWTNRAY
ncbi:hypothetical protein H3C66_00450 [Patescibacteria group bacterium]|nr:hypothetical protein [Patescibacteria group bacterium]